MGGWGTLSLAIGEITRKCLARFCGSLASTLLLLALMDQLLHSLFSNLAVNQPEAPLPPALEMLRSIGDEQTFMRVRPL